MILFGAGITLNEQDVAGVIGTVDVCVARSTTLMTVGNNLFGDAFSETFVENEILTPEFIG